MTRLVRGMVINVNLDPALGSETGNVRPCIIVTNDVYNEKVPIIQVVPLTEWTSKKARIRTNIPIQPSRENGLSKKSIADCLQPRPIRIRHRLVKIRGKLSPGEMKEVDLALRVVFGIDAGS